MTLNYLIKSLNVHKSKLTWQQYRTLKGQAINGDIKGAAKGLKTILKAKANEKENHNAQ